MFNKSNEKGYALIVILFAIVFITTITSVFARGVLSNITQEKTVDDNNLVVVAAESGIDYYVYELKKAYNKEELKDLLNENLKKASDSKQNPINYDNIQNVLVEKVKSNLRVIIENIKVIQSVDTYDMADDFQHKLIITPLNSSGNSSLTSPVIDQKKLDNGDIQISLIGKVKGEQKIGDSENRKEKELTFDLIFLIPSIEPESKNEEDNDLDIISPTNVCKNLVEISKENCLFPPSEIKKLEKITSNSKVYLDGNYDGYNKIKIEDSSFYVNNVLNGNNFDIQKSKLHVKGNLNKYGNTKLQESSAIFGGNFSESGSIDFQKSNIIVNGKFEFKSYNDNKIQTSFMNVESDFLASNPISIQDTHLTVGGMMRFNSGGKFQDSFLNVLRELDAPSKLETQKTHITIGKFLNLNSGGDFQETTMLVGSYLNSPSKINTQKSEIQIKEYLQINAGADIQKTKMIIGSYVNSPSALDIQDSQIVIGGNLSLNSYSKWQEDTTIKIGGKLYSPNGVEIHDSTVITKNTDVGKLDLQNTNFCAEDFKVGYSFNMDDKSKVYYLNSTNRTGKNIEKLTRAEFDIKCAYNLNIQNPELPQKPKVPEQSEQTPSTPGIINWENYKPEVDKVTY